MASGRTHKSITHGGSDTFPSSLAVDGRIDEWWWAELFEIPWRIYNLFVIALAVVWRRLLFRTTVIAITGSRGKTTARECLARILGADSSITATRGNDNGRRGVPRTILRARPRDRYLIVEIGVDRPGVMWRGAFVISPDVVVVTSVESEHMENFHTLEAVAQEKARLVGWLGRHGTAVLYGDDPRVREMAAVNKGQTALFGTADDCNPRMDALVSNDRDGLSFRLHSEGESALVETRLIGRHWAPAVASAIATARVLGVPLAQSTVRLNGIESYPARMQPVRLNNGAIIVRDEYNGSVGTLRTALAAFSQLDAQRRVAVLSDFTDDPRPPEERLGDIGRSVARQFDLVVFVGSNQHHATRAAVGVAEPHAIVHGFPKFQAAAEFLRQELKEGDLVLLKGQCRDHLSRIYFALTGPVNCWVTDCQLRDLCDCCPALGPQATSRL